MFLAYINQIGRGCNYTIACGEELLELKAATYEEALDEVICKVMDYPNQPTECEGEGYDPEIELEEIILYEVSSKTILPIDEWHEEEEKQKKEIKQKELLEAEQLQYRQLKKKYG